MDGGVASRQFDTWLVNSDTSSTPILCRSLIPYRGPRYQGKLWSVNYAIVKFVATSSVKNNRLICLRSCQTKIQKSPPSFADGGGMLSVLTEVAATTDYLSGQVVRRSYPLSYAAALRDLARTSERFPSDTTFANSIDSGRIGKTVWLLRRDIRSSRSSERRSRPCSSVGRNAAGTIGSS